METVRYPSATLICPYFGFLDFTKLAPKLKISKNGKNSFFQEFLQVGTRICNYTVQQNQGPLGLFLLYMMYLVARNVKWPILVAEKFRFDQG